MRVLLALLILALASVAAWAAGAGLPTAPAGSYVVIRHPGGPIGAHIFGQVLVVAENLTPTPQTYLVDGVAYGLAFYRLEDQVMVALSLTRGESDLQQTSGPYDGHLDWQGPGSVAFDESWLGAIPTVDLPPGDYIVQRVVAFSFSGHGAYGVQVSGWIGARLFIPSVTEQ